MKEFNPLQQPSYPTNSTQPLVEVQAELRLQRELLERNQRMLRSIQRSVRVSSAFSVVRFVLILIPLVLALVFLPPILRSGLEALNQYQQVFSGSAGGLPQGLDIQQLQDLLQKSGMFER